VYFGIILVLIYSLYRKKLISMVRNTTNALVYPDKHYELNEYSADGF
jgi:hypothetical protein